MHFEGGFAEKLYFCKQFTSVNLRKNGRKFMSGGMKTLAKETAIYGGTTIIQRSLSWFLALFWTYYLPSQADMGIVNRFYAWFALFLVVLTYGMETGFFRFANKQGESPDEVFSTAITSLGVTTFAFLLISFLFLSPIARGLDMAGQPHCIAMMLLIIAFDVMGAIPFAYLRYKNRPVRFAAIKLSNIVTTILLNLFFFLLAPWLAAKYPGAFSWYRVEKSVEYILIANLIASSLQTLLVFAQVRIKYRFGGFRLLKRMLFYSLPLLILGVAGILNQNAAVILFPEIYPDPSPGKLEAYKQLGIYSASMKIAIVLIVLTQAFRYAFEPFIFAKSKDTGNNKAAYAEVTKYFIIFGFFVVLAVMGYMDLIKHLIKSTYHAGLIVVPIVMMGELFFGVYFNLSLWYKLTDRTRWGTYMSLVGLAITLAVNILFVPACGYMACAWASFVANLAMMILSYLLGQKYYPIRYDLKSAAFFLSVALLLLGIIFLGFRYIDTLWLRLLLNSFAIALYVLIAVRKGFPAGAFKRLPGIRNFMKRYKKNK